MRHANAIVGIGSTVLGLLPFVLLTLGLMENTGFVPFMATVGLCGYATAILSFLGGIRWGLEIAARPDGGNGVALGVAALTPLPIGLVLGAGLTLAQGDRFILVWTFGAWAAIFVAFYVWDRLLEGGAPTPAWFRLARAIGTAGAVIILCAAAGAIAAREAAAARSVAPPAPSAPPAQTP